MTMYDYTRKKIYVLYGSQTGSSEDIARTLTMRLTDECNLPTECFPLNQAQKLDLKTLARVLVVICSTTGNGDPPENAEAFWRSIKLRSNAADRYLDLPYVVLGLVKTLFSHLTCFFRFFI